MSPAASAAPAPTDGPQAAVGREAVRTYQDWWAAQVDAFGRTDSTSAQLRVLSTGPALSQVVVSLQQLHTAKLVMTGRPVNSPVVTKVDLSGTPYSVELDDCVDVTGWHQADAGNGSIKDPPQRLSRYVVHVVLRTIGSIWKVFEFKPEAGRTC